MKIVLLNRDESSHFGGDVVQVRAYKKALEKLGHTVDYKHELDPDLRGYDEAWLHHINMGWTLRQWRKVKEASVPYKVIAIYYKKVYSDINHDQMSEILQGAVKVFCLSSAEKRELLEEFPDLTNVEVVNNGVDKDIFKDQGLVRRYVMTAGRYTAAKGQLRVIQACKELGIQSLCVGTKWDQNYLEECRAASSEGSIVLEGLTQEELSEWYNSAKVYVCASDDDRNNLCVLEAAACGCSILNSIFNRGHEWLGGIAIDPSVPEDLKSQIRVLYDAPIKDERDRVPSWDDVVKEILESK